MSILDDNVIFINIIILNCKSYNCFLTCNTLIISDHIIIYCDTNYRITCIDCECYSRI